jgi:hypothetical protein
MQNGISRVLALALVLACSLMVFPVSAVAKCTKDCKTQITSEARTCKAKCAKGKAGKECRKACRDEKRTDTKACKHASNPIPPGCGEASPSGAFID